MWDIIFQNLPTILLATLAIIICGAELIKALRIWKEERDRRVNHQVEVQTQEQNNQMAMNDVNENLKLILEKITAIEDRLGNAESRLDKLTESDMHDIKAWIVEQYHKFYIGQGWVDAFSAETIDRRYEDYIEEGGNSYIKNLMDQLHTLSMDPAHTNKSILEQEHE
jgi:hypothetical protein